MTSQPHGQGSLPKAFLLVTMSYVLSMVAAVAVVRWLTPHVPGGPFGLLFAADFASTCVVFAFSFAFVNSSFYDAYWSVAPLAIAPWFIALGPNANRPRQWLMLALVTAWGIRLTWNWARGWTGLHHEDWRYVRIREQTGRLYWPVSFLGIHMFPTVLVYLGCLPLWSSLVESSAPLGPLDAVATLVTGGAILIEGTADQQLRAFVLSKPEKGTILRVGLWKYSRHPNYFGELSFWWGIALFAVATGPVRWWTFAGAGLMTALFVFISGPLLDKRSLDRRPGYADHMKRTSMLIPFPPRGD